MCSAYECKYGKNGRHVMTVSAIIRFVFEGEMVTMADTYITFVMVNTVIMLKMTCLTG